VANVKRTGDEEPEIPTYYGLTDYDKRQLLHVRLGGDDGSRCRACSPETRVCGDMSSRALQTRVCPITNQPVLAPLHGDLIYTATRPLPITPYQSPRLILPSRQNSTPMPLY
jgi:hypothetical protein